jgi:hypothetical protein
MQILDHGKLELMDVMGDDKAGGSSGEGLPWSSAGKAIRI